MPTPTMPTCGCLMGEKPRCQCAIWPRWAHRLLTLFPLLEPPPPVFLPQVQFRPEASGATLLIPPGMMPPSRAGMMPPSRAIETRPRQGASRSPTLGGAAESGLRGASTYE